MSTTDIDPGRLRAVICDRCSAPTGEYALNRHGICKGCEDRGVEPWADGHGHHASADDGLDDWDVPSCQPERATFTVNPWSDDIDPAGVLYYETDDCDWAEDDERDSTADPELEIITCYHCGEPYDGPSENVS